MTRHSRRHWKMSSREYLHQLYELWQPQFTESYRRGACAPEPKPEAKLNKSTSKVSKLKIAETVVETVNLMKKSRSQSRGNLTRISSIGSLENVSPSGSAVRKSSVSFSNTSER